MKKGDKALLLLIAIIIVLGFGVLYYQNNILERKASGVVIKIGNQIYREISASEMQEHKVFTINITGGGYNTIEIEKGRIRVVEANCPDKVCVKSGWISKPGEVIVCLPHKLIIQINGKAADVDSVAY